MRYWYCHSLAGRKALSLLASLDACEYGRQTNPELLLGVCGEHGGDPKSIEFFQQCGLDYVSCSPFRVPVARLAAAQAAVKYGKTQKEHKVNKAA